MEVFFFLNCIIKLNFLHYIYYVVLYTLLENCIVFCQRPVGFTYSLKVLRSYSLGIRSRNDDPSDVSEDRVVSHYGVAHGVILGAVCTIFWVFTGSAQQHHFSRKLPRNVVTDYEIWHGPSAFSPACQTLLMLQMALEQ